MPGIEVYERDYRLVVEYAGLGLEIRPPQQIVFSVSKSLKPEPNKGNFKIWGLNRQHITTLEGMKRARVEFAAGYKGGTARCPCRNGAHLLLLKAQPSADRW